VDGDNTRLLREIGDTVAGYRATVTGYTLTVNSAGAAGVTISATPSSYSGISNYSIEGIVSGTGIILTAPETSGEAVFTSWSGCDSAVGTTCSLTVTANTSVTANYQLVCGQPAGITVPASDDDGSYTVSWGASATSGVVYVLEEATNADFSSNLRTVYTGSATSAAISGQNNGVTYHYRVKATRSGYLDSPWIESATACAVSIPGPGNLQVTISPQAAVDAGAGWSIDGGSIWQESGETLTGLTIFNNPYTVTFRPVSGWTSPAEQSVTIESGETATPNAVYTAPQIAVSCTGQSLEDGTGRYDFGRQRLKTTVWASCSIENTGTAPLLLSGSPLVAIGGDPAFAVGQPTGDSGEFTLLFTPTRAASVSATISIANNDPAANPFTFTVTGQGLVNLSWLMLLLE
jgi:hypothetical protein